MNLKNLFNVTLLMAFVAMFSLQVSAQSPASGPMESEEVSGGADQNIIELAVGTESLSTLVAAVKAAGLVETLQGAGPFTVFAPTNAAFAALPEGTVESLLKPENKDKLISILTYHVVPAKVLSTDLQNGQTAATVQGANITVSLNSDGAFINDAKVAAADVMATNGVVHVIDKVILPPAEK